MEYEAQPDLRGPVRIWLPPKPGVQYVIGADVAEGLEKGDNSAGVVLQAHDMQHAATWYGKIDPFAFGEELAWLGHFYNRALIAVEKNNHGESTVRHLLHTLKYPNLYNRKQRADRKMSAPKAETADYGWLTRAPQKRHIRAMIDKILAARAPVYDEHLIGEGLTWLLDDGGMPETAENAHDDFLMALGIAYSVTMEQFNVSFITPAPHRVRSDDEKRKSKNKKLWRGIRSGHDGRAAKAAEDSLRGVPDDLIW